MTRGTAEIEAEISATRDDLADTIDALGAKFDVKAHLKQSASDPARTAREHWPALAVVAGSVVAVVALVVVRKRR